MTELNTVLIAGVNGLIGRAIAQHFTARPSWRPIGLSRRKTAASPQPFLAVDLLDAQDCAAKLESLGQVTHLVYAARYDHKGGEPESASTNRVMLANLLDAVEPAAPALRHVHLVHGTKYYGHALRPRPLPYREEDERAPLDLFYYEQQDLIAERQRGKPWNWSVSRPHSFCSLRTDEPRSMTLLLAVYATLLREMGLPLIYPGTPDSFAARTQFTWLPTLARAVEWMLCTPACANQAYNVVNGDPRSWSQLWPVIAGYFGMRAGEPQAVTFADLAADKGAVWQKIVARHGLRPFDLQRDVQWVYGDYVLSLQWDVVSDMCKAGRDGFTERVDTEKMLVDSFDFYRRQKLIP
jgi:nucleoside-diphosphate-sugar epimerase